MPYKYRNLPCNIRSDAALWCVVGKDSKGGSGVLEWCFDKEDAEERKMLMLSEEGRFSKLKAEKWQKAKDKLKVVLFDVAAV